MCEPVILAVTINADGCSSFRNLIFFLFLLKWTKKTALQLTGRGILGTIIDAYSSIQRILYGLFLRSPVVRSRVKKQLAESIAKLEKKLVPQGPGISHYLTLPKEGWTEQQISAELSNLGEMEHTRWEDGKVSGAVYHGGAVCPGQKSLSAVQAEAYVKFSLTNLIHPELFPGKSSFPRPPCMSKINRILEHPFPCAAMLTLTLHRGEENGGGSRCNGSFYVQRATWCCWSDNKRRD